MARTPEHVVEELRGGPAEAFAEVTHAEAEHLADYMTTPERFAVFARMEHAGCIEHAARLKRRRGA